MITLRNVVAADLIQLIVIEIEGFTPEEAATKEAFIEHISDSFIIAEKEGVIVGYINGPIIDSPYIADDLFEKIKANPTTGGYQSILGPAVAKHTCGTSVARLLLNHLKELSVAIEPLMTKVASILGTNHKKTPHVIHHFRDK